MKLQDDPFVALAGAGLADAIADAPPATAPCPVGGVALGRLHGFDLLDQPLVAGLAALPGQVVPARSTVPLRRAQLGQAVVVCFEQGDPLRPIVLGVVDARPLRDAAPAAPVLAEIDGERRVIAAEREVVLRCGEASITLTRAGKVLIQGTYILSRSKGCNKIKGAAIDLN